MKNVEEEITINNYKHDASAEWERLVQDSYHKLEFDTTMRFLKKYLPEKGHLLDAGGGPGRYTVTLAKKNYKITLLDLVPELLDFAREKIQQEKVEDQVENIILGTITDLSRLEDNSFDAVLCLGGPISHIHPAAARKKAVSELLRVAKKGAYVFISVMSKYGMLISTPIGWPQEVQYKEHYKKVVFEGDDYRWRGDGFCHYFTSAELEKLLNNFNLQIVEKIGLEGLNVDLKSTNKFAEKYPKAWQNWLDIHEKICTDSVVVDLSGHMLMIARKI